MADLQSVIDALLGRRASDHPVEGYVPPSAWLNGGGFTQEPPKTRPLPDARAIEAMLRSMKQHYMIPGEVMRGIQTTTPGMLSDEDVARAQMLENQGAAFGPQQAMNMITSGMTGGGIYGAPRGATGIGGGRLIQPTVPPYYSAAAKAVEASKMPKGTAEQWTGYLRNAPGVKQEELQTAGLHDYLASQPGQITREQVAEQLRGGGPKIKEVNKGNKPKFEQYQLPGGTNYGEKLLTLPNENKPDVNFNQRFKEISDKYGGVTGPELVAKWTPEESDELGGLARASDAAAKRVYKSSHWDEPNVLVHVRHNDRTIPGKNPGDPPQKALHLEELQSDWHQAGRKQGYKQGPVPNSDFVIGQPSTEHIQPAAREQFLKDNPDIVGVYHQPTGEHVSNYRQEAAQEAIDSGRVQDLYTGSSGGSSKVPDAPFKQTWPDLALKRMVRQAAEGGYDALAWTPGDVQADRYDLSKHLDSIGYNKRGDNTYNVTAWGKNGDSVWNNQSATPEMLESNLGKEMAEKIVNGVGREEGPVKYLEDLDLKVGGEGMKGFYDKMLVDKANALGKKYGAKVEQRDMTAPDTDVSDEAFKTWAARRGANPESDSARQTFEEEVGLPENKSGKTWVLPITPELKKAALEQGFPMFSLGGAAGVGAAAAASQPQQPPQVTVNPVPGYYQPVPADLGGGT